ncbi:MAG TPA: DUF4190 domain-containing protein [Plantibacter sp.]|uniref:DUF4190 domain-containing protein n=1 Tax=unclassified Plantibacter TaxID=2624265 RepID=UPI002B5225C6|nr:DUF4190 domain-containing protein [Plantibacter sp.]
MDQQQPDGRAQQPPVPPELRGPPQQAPQTPYVQPEPARQTQPGQTQGTFPTPAAWQPAPQHASPQPQPQPRQSPYGTSPSAPPAAWQGDHATYLQTVPTAVYQAPSQGGYPSYQQAQAAAPATGTGRSTWSLVLGLIGLVISIFVGWGFPLSITAIVMGFVARRREPLGRGRALTGIVTGFVGLLCSAGWFAYSIVVIIGYVST